MEDTIVLFCHSQMAETKRLAIGQDVSKRVAKQKCIVMPKHILGGIAVGDMLLLRTYRSYADGGREEEEARLSALVGIKCILLDPHVDDMIVIPSA